MDPVALVRIYVVIDTDGGLITGGFGLAFTGGDVMNPVAFIRIPRWKPASLLAGGKRGAPRGAAWAFAGGMWSAV